MPKTFLIADTHFGSDALRLYENRPFEDTQTMDEAIIARWNETVAPEDIVYHLGDFGAEGREKEILSRLKGHIRLVKGNHDHRSNDDYRRLGFEECYDCPIIIEGFWILSHEPLYVNTNMPYANLFGHVHANPNYNSHSTHGVCVSVERTGYTPIELSEIKELIQKQ